MAGLRLGKPYRRGLAALDNVPQIYIQTTTSVDGDWKPIGTMTDLTNLRMRVKNDRMNKSTRETSISCSGAFASFPLRLSSNRKALGGFSEMFRIYLQ